MKSVLLIILLCIVLNVEGVQFFSTGQSVKGRYNEELGRSIGQGIGDAFNQRSQEIALRRQYELQLEYMRKLKELEK